MLENFTLNTGFYSDRAFQLLDGYFRLCAGCWWNIERANDGETILQIKYRTDVEPDFIGNAIAKLRQLNKPGYRRDIFSKKDYVEALIVLRKTCLMLQNSKNPKSLFKGGWISPDYLSKKNVMKILTELEGTPRDMLQTETVGILKEAWANNMVKSQKTILDIKVEAEKKILDEKVRHSVEKQNLIDEYLTILGKNKNDKKERKKAEYFFTYNTYEN